MENSESFLKIMSIRSRPQSPSPLEAAQDIDSVSWPCDNVGTLGEILFVLLMLMSQFLTQAAVGQTMNISDLMGVTFGVEHENGELSWFLAALSMTVGTFILISGRLGDMYGYKRMYLIGYAWFATFSLAVGFSGFGSSTLILDVMRALQGIGPAIMMPNTQALIGNFYPRGPRQNLVFCLFGAVAPGGFVVGVVMSAIFAQYVWWPWTFWICGIWSAAVAVVAALTIPRDIGRKTPGTFDYLGSFLGVGGLILINFAWSQGANVGWHVVYCYVLLIVGILMLVAFAYVESVVKNPLLPLNALKGDTGFVLGCIAAGWSCFAIWLYYTFRWSILVERLLPLLAAAHSVPAAVMGFVAALTGAYFLPRVPLSSIMLTAMIAFFVSITIMAFRPVGQIYWAQKFVSFVIGPFGMDLSFPAACILLSNALPSDQQGIAGSLVLTFVNYSIAIGLGIAGTVERYVVQGHPENTATTIKGIHAGFYMGMGLSGMGIVLGLVFCVLQIMRRHRSQSTDLEKDSLSIEAQVSSELSLGNGSKDDESLKLKSVAAE